MSDTLFSRAQHVFVGGVNSPVRAFAAVGGTPLFFRGGEGAWLMGMEGRRYVDYVCAWGAMIAGHAHPEVIEHVMRALSRGLGFGAPTEEELLLGEKIQMLLGAERLRLVNSGTEAAMTAVRLARGVTGRKKIVKFAGGYHGHADMLLAEPGSGALSLGVPGSAGVPEEAAAHTLVLAYNDARALTEAFSVHGKDIAAVIVEPICGNMNMVPGEKDFLAAISEHCQKNGALVIADEVLTGFRCRLGDVSRTLGLTPDLFLLGKVVGGGLPLAVVAGKKEIMEHLAPLGKVYQAGTMAGNPVACAAGLATLSLVEAEGFYEALEQRSAALAKGLQEAGAQAGIPVSAQSRGGLLGMFFAVEPPKNLYEVKKSNLALFPRFFHGMLQEGIYWPPSAFESLFLSIAHAEEEIEKTLSAARRVFSSLSA